MEAKQILLDFLKEEGYSNDKNIIGVIFYGSYQTHTNNKNSDLDFTIVYKNEANKESYKAYRVYKNVELEYYERSLQSLYDRLDHDYNNFEDTLLSTIGYGEFININDNNQDNKIEELEILRSKILEKYKDGLPKLSSKECKNQAKGLSKSIERLCKMNDTTSPYFKIYYGQVLEKIRKYYSKKNGFSNISPANVLKLYTNDEVRIAQHKTIPEKDFLDKYFTCINEFDYESLKDLFEYTIRDLENVDFKNIRIGLGNKHH